MRPFHLKPLFFLLLLSALCLVSLPACSLGFFLKPTTEFSAQQAVPAPDYRQTRNWIARPEKQDWADTTPPGSTDRQTQAQADVFFVHPSAWFSRTVWNHPLWDPQAQEITDQISMADQASVFNGSARIYAPRYRQATLGAYFVSPEMAEPSFALAYRDVARAFADFESHDNRERPFILAGHSQGSLHLLRLLEKIDADPDLRRFPLSAPRQCTNPISWQQNEAPTPPAAHRGAVEMINTGKAFHFQDLIFSQKPMGIQIAGLKAPQAGLLSAQCQDGVLRVPDLQKRHYPALETQPGNYHLLDYELFYMDIRHNAAQRVQAWQAKQTQ